MKYPSYTTPLTEQNFVEEYSLRSTLSVADEHGSRFKALRYPFQPLQT